MNVSSARTSLFFCAFLARIFFNEPQKLQQSCLVFLSASHFVMGGHTIFVKPSAATVLRVLFLRPNLLARHGPSLLNPLALNDDSRYVGCVSLHSRSHQLFKPTADTCADALQILCFAQQQCSQILGHYSANESPPCFLDETHR